MPRGACSSAVATHRTPIRRDSRGPSTWYRSVSSTTPTHGGRCRCRAFPVPCRSENVLADRGPAAGSVGSSTREYPSAHGASRLRDTAGTPTARYQPVDMSRLRRCLGRRPTCGNRTSTVLRLCDRRGRAAFKMAEDRSTRLDRSSRRIRVRLPTPAVGAAAAPYRCCAHRRASQAAGRPSSAALTDPHRMDLKTTR
jgi:hypothetical protein